MSAVKTGFLAMDLFQYASQEKIEREAPLAARMRPRTLDEFVGQEHIVGPGRLLRRAIQADQLSSVIFYGPPGSGKTTLARIIANTTRSHFITINAVLAGVKEIRDAIEIAQERRNLYGQRTILFVDEVHRWNKAQQDALLPWVENGLIIFIGATTENPYFEVIRPLVSRSRIFQLRQLSQDDLRVIARRALQDPERGYGRLRVELHEDALDHLVDVANGDARSVLNALELAVETTPPDERGVIVIDMAVAEESIQRRAVLYDKDGDIHYDTISAFIKSLRGSDPDAALYWLARMVYAGEDPRFLFRRMLIFASEDVGLADPDAVRVVNACAEAFDRVGLPEGRFHLAQACLYLATAPKSNSAFGFFDALAAVEKEQEEPIPPHLKDASRDKEGFGHGVGYLYPHAYRDHWVAQQYLPDRLQGRIFYQPGDQGYEARIRDEVTRRREIQLAVMLERTESPLEILSTSPTDSARERWLQRTINATSQRLTALRDWVFQAAKLQRHHVVLDLNASTGLLTWEAIRQVPEGGVYALARTAEEAQTLREMAASLPILEQPIILVGELDELPLLIADQVEGTLYFDAIMGRNALTRHPDKIAAARILASLVHYESRVILVQNIPRRTQRLYQLVDLASLGDLAQQVIAAEEAIYQLDDPMVNWDAEDLRRALEMAGFAHVELQIQPETTERRISPALIERWFAVSGASQPDGQLSYAQHLLKVLKPEEVARVQRLFEHQLAGQTVLWSSAVACLVAKKH